MKNMKNMKKSILNFLPSRLDYKYKSPLHRIRKAANVHKFKPNSMICTTFIF